MTRERSTVFPGALFVLCNVAAGLTFGIASTRPLGIDPPARFSQHLATRKSRGAFEEPGGLLPTQATLFNTHTGTMFALAADEPTAEQFSGSLADRVTGEVPVLDERLLGLLQRLTIPRSAKTCPTCKRPTLGAPASAVAFGEAPLPPEVRIELVSGFRSWKLNEMLRKKGHKVASHSQHSLGKALDFRVVGWTPAELKGAILAAGWKGGIGQYDGPSDRFVHADVGPPRFWWGSGRSVDSARATRDDGALR